jgi:tetratricopeptide (TPR) repeat protein
MRPAMAAFFPQPGNLVQRLYLPSRSRFRGFHEQAAESANPTDASAPPALFERCKPMTETHDFSVQRTAAILFVTILLGSAPAAADPAAPALEWEPMVLQAKLAYQRSDYAAARDLSARALAVANSASVPELKVAEVLNVLGSALLGLNRPADAAPLLDRALSVRRSLLASPSLDLAVSLNNHAGVLLVTDVPDSARATASEAVAMFEALGETSSYEYGVSLNNLAAAHSNLGDYSRAVPVYEHARAVLTAQPSPDSPRILRLLINEGVALQRLGNLTGAGALYESAIETARQPPAIDAFALPNALRALGDLRLQQGRNADAERILTEALTLATAAVPADPLKTGAIEATLARANYRRGNSTAALTHFQAALSAMRVAQSTAPVAYASELNNYGIFLMSVKRLKPAGDAFEEAQRIFDAKLGAAHPNSVAVTVNRGTLAERRHNLSRAAELYQKAVDLDTAHFGRNHFRVALDLNSLGVFEHRRHHYDRAEQLLRESASILRAAWGPDHPEVGTVSSNLARTLWRQKRYGDAGPLLAEAIRILENAYGKDSPKLISLYVEYAQLLHDDQNYAGAETAKLSAMRIRVRQALGKGTESFY